MPIKFFECNYFFLAAKVQRIFDIAKSKSSYEKCMQLKKVARGIVIIMKIITTSHPNLSVIRMRQWRLSRVAMP